MNFYEGFYFLAAKDFNYPNNQINFMGDEFTWGIFDNVTLITPLITLAIVLLFYVVINRLTVKFRKRGHWFLFMCINALLAFVISFKYCQTIPGYDFEMGSDGWKLCIINLVWSCGYYFILSIGAKFLSIHANRNPF